VKTCIIMDDSRGHKRTHESTIAWVIHATFQTSRGLSSLKLIFCVCKRIAAIVGGRIPALIILEVRQG
jgi:hypothetical protein